MNRAKARDYFPSNPLLYLDNLNTHIGNTILALKFVIIVTGFFFSSLEWCHEIHVAIIVMEKLNFGYHLQNFPVFKINRNFYLKVTNFPDFLHSYLDSSSYIYLLPPSFLSFFLPLSSQEIQKPNKRLRLVSQGFLECEKATISIS